MDSYKNPSPTVDMVLFYKDFKRVVLIQRKNPPLGLALPGGFVNEGESLEAAIKREVQEELNVDAFLLEQFLTYSDPKRDPRKHVMSTVFLGVTTQEPKAGDDAAACVVIELEKALAQRLAFDHFKILLQVEKYVNYGTRPRFGVGTL